MKFELDKAILILERTSSMLYTLLKELPEDWTHENEVKGTLSPFGVLGHLVYGEITNWISRTKILLGNDKNKPSNTLTGLHSLKTAKANQ